jgi:putative sigma-54 modulation protein
MKVSITARHFDPTPDLKEHAESRVTRLQKFAADLLHANVVLEVEKYRQIAEVSVHGSHGDFKGRAESDDMFVSIDGACDKVEKQIRRQARMTKTRDGAKEELAMGTTRIASERVSPEMMSVEEATTRVEEGEEIVVFADADSGATRVVYRRADGTMKLIEVA